MRKNIYYSWPKLQRLIIHEVKDSLRFVLNICFNMNDNLWKLLSPLSHMRFLPRVKYPSEITHVEMKFHLEMILPQS